jgi:hypothetical protein
MFPDDSRVGLGLLYGVLAYVAFLQWRLGVLKRATLRGSPTAPRWLSKLFVWASSLAAWLVGVHIKSLAGRGLQAEQRRYLYVWHPHGFVSYVPTFLMGAMAIKGEPHGCTWC